MENEIDGKWHIFNQSNKQWLETLKKYPEIDFLK